jgi:hypothetical protein
MWSRLPKANAGIPRQKTTSHPSNYHPRMPRLLPLLAFLLVHTLPAAGQESGVPDPIPASRSPHELATQILHQSILQSVWGPPAYCVVRQSVHVFGKQVSGVGEYVRGGQGSGKLKFNLRMPAGDQLNTLLQVSDGQRMLTIEQIGGVRRRTEIDLDKIRPRIVLTNESLGNPVIAMYLAIGGQAEALRKIYMQYEWLSVREGNLGDVEVWWLNGQIQAQPPAVRSLAEADNLLFATERTGLLPTRIRLAIGQQNSATPFWLYQAEQLRDADGLKPGVRDDSLRIVTEWASPLALEPQQLTPDFFASPSSNEPLFDETERYLPPAQQVAGIPSEGTQR